MNLAVMVLVVFMLTGIAGVLYIERRQKRKAEEAEEQRQLELEQALTLDKKYEEDSMITVNVPNTSEVVQTSLIGMDASMIVRTLGLVIDDTIEISEEDQLKLLIALADLDFDIYEHFCNVVEDVYINAELEENKAA